MSAAPAFAFTTGPHEEMLADAMRAEGFGGDAVKVMDLSNSYTDFYQWVGASANPYSGQGTSVLGRLLIGNLTTEGWSKPLVAAATRSHFDNNPERGAIGAEEMASLGTTQGIAAEWERLQRSVWTLMRQARAEDNPQKALTVLGSSMHEVQDFYAHTNWIEPPKAKGLGTDGPGLEELGYGNYPTWFDVPASEREKLDIYGDSTPGHRPHGFWDSDRNRSLATFMNKDSPPRPYYLQAAITAYFATRQWSMAVRSWLNDDAFWRKMQRYQAQGRRDEELNDDLGDLNNIMLFSGRWEGQGEPIGGPSGDRGAAGDLLDLRESVIRFFDMAKSSYRREFERVIVPLAEHNPPGEVGPMPSSQPLQQAMQVVVMRVVKMASVGTLGLGDPWPDQADMFAVMGIDEEPFHTDVIHNENSFSFSNPYEPFTKYKVVPKGQIEGEPVESIEAEVKTTNQAWAGTDDSVFLRLGPSFRFELDKNWHDDFERGDNDTYSVPIDDAVRSGMRVGDITKVKIEKSPDRLAGGWKLKGIKLRVNGHRLYENPHIETWLEDDHRTWEARDFVPRDPQGPMIPIWLQLRDDDGLSPSILGVAPPGPYGGDDEGDINPFDARDIFSFGYVPGKKVEKTTQGGGELGGRTKKGGDDARVTFTVETLIPRLIESLDTGDGPGDQPPAPAPSTPPPPPLPDLIVTALDEQRVTVKNVGEGPAGLFRLRAETPRSEDTVVFAGLAAGASETRPFRSIAPCEHVEAMADDLLQVDETNETNNWATAQGGGCPVQHSVPNVIGDTEAEARERISNVSLIPISTTVVDLSCEHIGSVISQSPRGGTVAQPGTSVTIRIGVRDTKHECK